MTAWDADLAVDGDQTVVSLRGELDIAAVPDLDALVAVAVSRPAMKTLVLDMSGVDFLDSGGIGALINARRLCADHGADLRLEAVHPRTRRVLAIAGMIDLFGITEPAGRERRAVLWD
jgi:anti-sigma B factor antagonist/stage II sporulation protein AA (anti-sigma F factor antagonist)